MSERIHVKSESEFEDRVPEVVEVDDVSIGVVCDNGDFYGFLNFCPHQEGPVAKGRVKENLEGEWGGPGNRPDYEYTDELTIACPWHGWSFSLESGNHVGDDDFSIPTYPVTVEDGEVYVEY